MLLLHLLLILDLVVQLEFIRAHINIHTAEDEIKVEAALRREIPSNELNGFLELCDARLQLGSVGFELRWYVF